MNGAKAMPCTKATTNSHQANLKELLLRHSYSMLYYYHESKINGETHKEEDRVVPSPRRREGYINSYPRPANKNSTKRMKIRALSASVRYSNLYPQ